MGSNNEYRPEQMTIASVLREDKRYGNFDIKTEYAVTGLKFEGKRYAAVLDIAMIPKKQKVKEVQFRYANTQEPIAIRVMGQIHEKTRKAIQDKDQALALQSSKWFVLDIWYNYLKQFWNPERYTKNELEFVLGNQVKQYIYPEFLIE